MQTKKGVVFCHGRKHEPIDIYFRDLATWYYVDINQRDQPDLVVDVLDPTQSVKMLTLINDKIPDELTDDNLFDYVLIYHCPVGSADFYHRSRRLMMIGRSILKSTGQFIYYKYVNFALAYLRLNQELTKKYLDFNVSREHQHTVDEIKIEIGSIVKPRKVEEVIASNISLMMADQVDPPVDFSKLDYCLSFGVVLALECGYRGYKYLDQNQRPKYLKELNVGEYLRHSSDALKITLVFYA